MKMILTLAMLLMFTLSVNAAPADPVVATVNGSKILQSEFEQIYKQNLLYVSSKKVTKEKVLYDLINREIGIQRAKKNNLQNNPVVKRKIEDILFHAQVSKDLEGKLKKIVVTDSDVEQYYKDHKEYRTAHILFRMKADPDQEQVKAAMKQSLKVYNALKEDPSKFPELANKFSQSNVAPNGGDMGFQPAAQLAPEYFEHIKGKDVGYISPPIRTQFGYHIVKILAVKDFNAINLPTYKKIVYDIKRDSIIEQFFADLRKSASVKIEKKYLE